MAERVTDPEVFGEPVYTDNLIDTDVYGEYTADVATSNVTVNAVPLIVTTSIPTPTIVGSKSISAVPLIVTASVPVPAVVHTITATPLVVNTSIPAPGLSKTVSAPSLVINTSIPPPNILKTLAVNPLVVQTSIPVPTIAIVAAVHPPPLIVTTSIPTPSLVIGQIVHAVPLVVTASIPTPDLLRTSTSRVNAVPLQVVWSINAPTIISDTTPAPTPGVYTWSYKIDGVELNDYTNFVTQVPEIDNMQEMDVILAQIDGDYPVFIRLQPKDGIYTFLIAMQSCTWPVYEQRLAFLKSVFKQDVPHTFTAQARGMPIALSVPIVVQSTIVQPKERLVSIKTLAPKPVLV